MRLVLPLLLIFASAIAGPKPNLRDRLIGSWVSSSMLREQRLTLDRKGNYMVRMGVVGMKTGYLEITGNWKVEHNRLQLVPTNRRTAINPKDKSLIKEMKAYMKAMDEGAWKPAPLAISFRNENTIGASFDRRKPIIYKRVTKGFGNTGTSSRAHAIVGYTASPGWLMGINRRRG